MHRMSGCEFSNSKPGILTKNTRRVLVRVVAKGKYRSEEYAIQETNKTKHNKKNKTNKTKQNKTNKTNKTKQNKQNKTQQNKTKQNKTKQNKQNKTKQNKPNKQTNKQNKPNQNKAKQNKQKKKLPKKVEIIFFKKKKVTNLTIQARQPASFRMASFGEIPCVPKKTFLDLH